MDQGVLAEVDTNRSAWRRRLGEIDGDRAGTGAAVDKSHAPAQMRREKHGHRSGAAGMHRAAPCLVYMVRPLGTRRIGHVPLLRVRSLIGLVAAHSRSRRAEPILTYCQTHGTSWTESIGRPRRSAGPRFRVPPWRRWLIMTDADRPGGIAPLRSLSPNLLPDTRREISFNRTPPVSVCT